MAYRLTHPKYEVEKAYRVTVSGIADDEDLRKLTSPVTIDGEKVQALSVDVVEKRKNATVLEIVIKEGKNREIRRICENCGFLIRRLKRIRVGALSLGDLPTGKWRFLNESEERVLFEMTARQGENFLR